METPWKPQTCVLLLILFIISRENKLLFVFVSQDLSLEIISLGNMKLEIHNNTWLSSLRKLWDHCSQYQRITRKGSLLHLIYWLHLLFCKKAFIRNLTLSQVAKNEDYIVLGKCYFRNYLFQSKKSLGHFYLFFVSCHITWRYSSNV